MHDAVTDNLAAHTKTGTAPAVELSPLRYREIAEEVRRQPAWRTTADKCADYYDGKQITPEEAALLEERGMGELITNFVKPSVNALLGLEAKTRTDWRVAADRDEDTETAEALSAKLAEAERETRADVACSEGYREQVIAGVGWVYVGRNADPFGYKYLVENVHRNEMFWDWAARRPDLSDARYLVRQRWYAVEHVCAFFPEHAALIRAAGSGWAPEWLDLAKSSDPLLHAFNAETDSGDWMDAEWRNLESQLIQLREVWYRHYVRGLVIDLPGGRTVEFDKKNPLHVLAVGQGFATPRQAVFAKLRVSLWIGPHKLLDEDYGQLALPYVPFWGYREDRSRVPYGVVRDMLPMQDEINARRRKLLWLLSSKRVQVDSDALDTDYNDFQDLAEEVARADALIVTNPARMNRQGGLKVETDLSLSTQQYQVMQESQQAIQQVAGVYNAMMGRDDRAMSGAALSTLVEQGTNSQGDINDNYRFSRTLVGQRLLELIVRDLAGSEVEVLAGEEGKRKTILLNRPVVDSVTGIAYRDNDVSKALVKVALADVPSTPAYRSQTMTMLAEVIKGLPPQVQAPLVPYFLEATEHPKRREMADTVRKVLGITEEQDDPQVQQLQAALEQMQMAMQQGVEQYEGQIAELQQKLAEASLRLRDKGTELELAAAEEQRLAEAAQVSNEERRANIARISAETLRIRADTATKLATPAQPSNSTPTADGARIPVPRVGGDPGL